MIHVYCPKCGIVLAFDSDQAGSEQACINCSHRLIVPGLGHHQAQDAEAARAHPAGPEPGFYRAVLIESWRLFTRPQNALGLVFLTALVCFRFFIGEIDLSFMLLNLYIFANIGLITTILVWGAIIWYDMQVIASQASQEDDLPEPHMGDFFGFNYNALKSLYLLAVIVVLAATPCLIGLGVLRSLRIDAPLVPVLLAYVGVFLLPLLLLVVSLNLGIDAILNPAGLVRPLVRAPLAYGLIAVQFGVAATLLVMMEPVNLQDCEGPVWMTALTLLAKIGIQGLILWAVRGIGLFYRHFSCYFTG